jgi:hypothetical protein
MAHARPFWASTLQDLFNDIKSAQIQGDLTPAIELWVFRSPEGLQLPTFGSVGFTLTLSPKWGCDIYLVVPTWGVYWRTCYNLTHFNFTSTTNWRIYQWSLGYFKAWWNWTYLVVPSWGVYMIWLCTCHNLRHFHSSSATNWRIYQWSSGNFKSWWHCTYTIVPSWGVYLIQLWTCHNLRHFDCPNAKNWRIC